MGLLRFEKVAEFPLRRGGWKMPKVVKITTNERSSVYILHLECGHKRAITPADFKRNPTRQRTRCYRCK
jgi:hypothetical protein